MARTIAEITVDLKQQHPAIRDMVDGEVITLDATAYEVRISEWAAAVRRSELEAEEEAREEQRRQQAKAAYAKLKSGTLPNDQLQAVVAFLLRREFRDLPP